MNGKQNPPMSDAAKKYETARTRHFRSTTLHPTDEGTIGNIEKHGCALIHVVSDCRDDLDWSYTIGVFDTCGRPDLVTVGLPHKTAHACLNEAVNLQRAGQDLTLARQAHLLENVDCELRLVDQKWVRQLMNWANWYYGGVDKPVLQVIYPDLQNRFPWDPDFTPRFSQPLMQPGAPWTSIEQDFWDSVEQGGKVPDWNFPDKPHTSAFLSKAVHEGTEPVTYVSHDASDGAWQFLGDTMAEGKPVLVCLHHPIDNDPSLKELADLPLGWYAEREAPGNPWERYELPPEEADEEAEEPAAASEADS